MRSGRLGRLVLLTAAIGFIIGTIGAGPALAQGRGEGGMQLFKVISTKDEVTIGFSAAELKKLGGGGDVDSVASGLIGSGMLTAWMYAVRKAPDGKLQHAPVRRVSVFATSVVRIEPFQTDQDVVAPSQ